MYNRQLIYQQLYITNG